MKKRQIQHSMFYLNILCIWCGYVFGQIWAIIGTMYENVFKKLYKYMCEKGKVYKVINE